MPLVRIDPHSDVAPFEQVRVQVAGQVAAGRLQPGAKLPTVRALATQLGLAANTVARAYRELEADGIVSTEGRRGTFVRSATLDTGAADVRGAAQVYTTATRRAGLSMAEAIRLVEQTWDRSGDT